MPSLYIHMRLKVLTAHSGAILRDNSFHPRLGIGEYPVLLGSRGALEDTRARFESTVLFRRYFLLFSIYWFPESVLIVVG